MTVSYKTKSVRNNNNKLLHHITLPLQILVLIIVIHVNILFACGNCHYSNDIIRIRNSNNTNRRHGGTRKNYYYNNINNVKKSSSHFWLNIRCGADDNDNDILTSSTSTTEVDPLEVLVKSNRVNTDELINNNDIASPGIVSQKSDGSVDDDTSSNTYYASTDTTVIIESEETDLYKSLPKEKSDIDKTSSLASTTTSSGSSIRSIITPKKSLNDIQKEVISSSSSSSNNIHETLTSKESSDETTTTTTTTTINPPPKKSLHLLQRDTNKQILKQFHKNIIVPLSTLFLGQVCRPNDNKALTYQSTLFLSLLGSSLGFKSYLYFISVGFGLSLLILSSLTLVSFNLLSPNPIHVQTNLHTFLVFLWSIRLTSFLIYREYISWPQLHTKILEMNQRAQLQSKFSIWMSCSFYYTFLFLPCLSRMQQTLEEVKWGFVGQFGFVLQMVGLVIESIADLQKSLFKVADQGNNRNKWCRTGLWNMHTHPNYVGEVMFWLGTYISGLGSFHIRKHPFIAIFSTIGLFGMLLVMKTAKDQLDVVQSKSYGWDDSFLEYKERICGVGNVKFIGLISFCMLLCFCLLYYWL